MSEGMETAAHRMTKPAKEGSRVGRPYEPAEPAPPEDRTPQDKGNDTAEGQQATPGAEQPQQKQWERQSSRQDEDTTNGKNVSRNGKKG